MLSEEELKKRLRASDKPLQILDAYRGDHNTILVKHAMKHEHTIGCLGSFAGNAFAREQYPELRSAIAYAISEVGNMVAADAFRPVFAFNKKISPENVKGWRGDPGQITSYQIVLKIERLAFLHGEARFNERYEVCCEQFQRVPYHRSGLARMLCQVINELPEHGSVDAMFRL
jgi:hypothetical protein